jgi:hypothetical protein
MEGTQVSKASKKRKETTNRKQNLQMSKRAKGELIHVHTFESHLTHRTIVRYQ